MDNRVNNTGAMGHHNKKGAFSGLAGGNGCNACKDCFICPFPDCLANETAGFIVPQKFLLEYRKSNVKIGGKWK